jgi:hypothetical protein
MELKLNPPFRYAPTTMAIYTTTAEVLKNKVHSRQDEIHQPDGMDPFHGQPFYGPGQ